VPPLIVHASADERSMSASFAANLLPGWVVGTSPSGYLSNELFYSYILLLIQVLQPSLNTPHFVYLDGYHSHWFNPALKLALKSYLFVRFYQVLNFSGLSHF
jgi:hypothetical protein